MRGGIKCRRNKTEKGDDVLDNRLPKTRSEGILFRAEWRALVNRSFEKRLAPMPEISGGGGFFAGSLMICRCRDCILVFLSSFFFSGGCLVVVVVADYIPFPGSLCGCELELELKLKLLVWDSIVGT